MKNSQQELLYIGSIPDITKEAVHRVPGPYSGISYYSLGVNTEGNFYILFLLRSANQDKKHFRKEYDRRQKLQIVQPITFDQDVRYLSLRGGFYRHPKNPHLENHELCISVETIPSDGTDEDVQSVFKKEKEFLYGEVRFDRLRAIRVS